MSDVNNPNIRPITMAVHTLLRNGVSHDYPGLAQTVVFDDILCPIDGDVFPKYIVEEGFVVKGFDSQPDDSLPAPAGWEYYPTGEASKFIHGWTANDLEWHTATKIYCSNNPGNYYIVSEKFQDVDNTFRVCCSGTPNIPSAALALKQSNKPLTPNTLYACGTEAIFKNLAVLSAADISKNYVYSFRTELINPGRSVHLNFNITRLPLMSTTSLTRRWPNDYVGLTSAEGITLIDDHTPVGVNEMPLSVFDGGVIDLMTEIEKSLGAGHYSQISVDEMLAALPQTNCFQEESGSDSSDDGGIFDDQFSGEFA